MDGRSGKTGANQSNASDRVRKMRWIAIGLFAPDLVVYNAWTQRKKVKQITRKARESQRMAKHLGMPQVFEWTQYHSWYMIMGGFYLKTTVNETVDYFIPGSPDLILTAYVMTLLTRTAPPLLPALDVELIKDRSKADVIIKALALLLTLYQVLSGITRLGLGLPVSQLEINTCGHAFCAFAILVMWFRKPRIKIRTKIRDEWANPLCAYLWMCSKLSCTTVAGSRGLEIRKLFPLPRNVTVEKIVAAGKEEESQLGRAEIVSTTQAGKESCEGRGSEAACINHQLPLGSSSEAIDSPSSMPQTLAGPAHTLSSIWTSWALPRIDPVHNPEAFEEIMKPALKEKFQPAEMVYDSTTTANRACLAMSFLRYWNTNIVKGSNPATVYLGVKAYEWPVRAPEYYGTLITDHVSDWFTTPESRVWYPTRIVPTLSIALLSTLYGALHGWAWHAHFPTQVIAKSTSKAFQRLLICTQPS